MATKCRVSPPNSIQLLTRRTTQRQYLLRPDPLLVQANYYILGYLQIRYAVEYHTVSILSNHHSSVLTVRAVDGATGDFEDVESGVLIADPRPDLGPFAFQGTFLLDD